MDGGGGVCFGLMGRIVLWCCSDALPNEGVVCRGEGLSLCVCVGMWGGGTSLCVSALSVWAVSCLLFEFPLNTEPMFCVSWVHRGPLHFSYQSSIKPLQVYPVIYQRYFQPIVCRARCVAGFYRRIIITASFCKVDKNMLFY